MSFEESIHPESLRRRVGQGAAVAAMLIVLALMFGGSPNPNYMNDSLRWILHPLLFVPLAGAAGGAVYYSADRFRARGPWQKVLADSVTLSIYGLLLTVAFILGVNGPH